MKNKEELSALKGEAETLRKKLTELNDEELHFVTGSGTHEIADVLIHGLMSDGTHPGLAMNEKTE